MNRAKGLKIKNLQNKENNKKQKADNCIKNTNTIINIVKPKIKKKKKKKNDLIANSNMYKIDKETNKKKTIL